MRYSLFAIAAFLLALQTVQAATRNMLVLCTLDKPFPPFTHPDGSGQAQRAISTAASGATGIQLQWVTAPRRRCLLDLSTDTVQGVLAAYDAARTGYAAYPMLDGKPDERRSVVTVRVRFYQRAGGTLNWDGHALRGAAKPLVAVQAGFVYASQLSQLGIRADEGAISLEQQFAKLADGRVDAVLAMEVEAGLLVQKQYADRITALEPPFEDIPLYLAVSRPYYRQNTTAVEALWARLRQPPVQRALPAPSSPSPAAPAASAR